MRPGSLRGLVGTVVTDDSSSPGVLRSSYLGRDLDEVEQFISAHYTHVSLSLPDDQLGLRFRHDSVAVPSFSISRLSTTLTYAADAEAMGSLLIISPRVPSRVVFESPGYATAATVDDSAILVPVDFDLVSRVDQGADIDMIGLDPDALGDYVEASIGLPADRLTVSELNPISPAMNAHLRATVAHVRDDVLSSPYTAASPLVVDSAFRALAAAALSTFPNTALATATDPEGQGVRGDVPPARLREIIDYIDAHPDRPIGPRLVSELAGAPAREAVEGLRRYRDVHPAALLWLARMRGVRRALSESDPEDGTSWRALAARWGFTHLGRFRVAYARLFGEPPEDTLRR